MSAQSNAGKAENAGPRHATGTESNDPDSEIGALIDAAYAALDFPPGSEPDWAAFNAVFHRRALLGLRVFPSDPHVRVLSLTEYAAAQLEHDLPREGYSETPLDRVVELMGDVATVRQRFTMNFAGGRSVPALDLFSLVHDGAGWRVLAVVSDIESGPGPAAE